MYEQLYDSSDTCSDADPFVTEGKSILVNEATVSHKAMPEKEESVQIQELTTLSK